MRFNKRFVELFYPSHRHRK